MSILTVKVKVFNVPCPIKSSELLKSKIKLKLVQLVQTGSTEGIHYESKYNDHCIPSARQTYPTRENLQTKLTTI